MRYSDLSLDLVQLLLQFLNLKVTLFHLQMLEPYEVMLGLGHHWMQSFMWLKEFRVYVFWFFQNG